MNFIKIQTNNDVMMINVNHIVAIRQGQRGNAVITMLKRVEQNCRIETQDLTISTIHNYDEFCTQIIDADK